VRPPNEPAEVVHGRWTRRDVLEHVSVIQMAKERWRVRRSEFAKHDRAIAQLRQATLPFTPALGGTPSIGQALMDCHDALDLLGYFAARSPFARSRLPHDIDVGAMFRLFTSPHIT